MAEKNSGLFKKYRSRVVKEGILKAVVCGLIVGFAVLIVTALAFWFAGVPWGLWLSIALFAAATGASVPAFYFLKFKPTAKAIAKRIDQLGLEERIITMMELEKDESFIAMKQREDALAAMKKADHMLIKVVVTTALVVAVSVTGAFGVGAGTVSALYTAGVIPSGMDLLHRVTAKDPGTYTVSYSISDGQGSILDWTTNEVLYTSIEESADETPEETPGEGTQGGAVATAADISASDSSDDTSGSAESDTSDTSDTSGSAESGDSGETGEEEVKNVFTLQEGENCIPVIAEPADGWVFVQWSDGLRDPYRYDLAVSEDIEVTALFEQLDESADQDGDGQPGEGEGEEGEEGEDDGAPKDEEASDGPSSDGPPNDGANGGRDDSAQQIENGDTYYGDKYDEAYEDAMDKLVQDDSIPDWLKEIISDYYDAIQP